MLVHSMSRGIVSSPHFAEELLRCYRELNVPAEVTGMSLNKRNAICMLKTTKLMKDLNEKFRL